MTNFEKLQSAFGDLETEYSKFKEKGNKAAGTRARKALNEIKKLSSEMRKEIQAAKNS